MKRFDNVALAPNQYQALGELRRRLFDEFDVEKAICAFASIAAGEVSLKITGLIWLEDIIEKLAQKHSVRQQEVREVFAGFPHFHF
ncbi:MAG: hypothetical protein KAX26_17085, partial [Anaerolineae bacterium]|nr:hypothetical protein [Anaerolineae bacterium]